MKSPYLTAYHHYKQQTMIKLITGRTKIEGEEDWSRLESSGQVLEAVLKNLEQTTTANQFA